MILVSLSHGRIEARLGKGWTRESKERLMVALQPLSSDLERAELSSALASTVETLHRIAREQADLPEQDRARTD